jgi:hypothetical protein
MEQIKRQIFALDFMHVFKFKDEKRKIKHVGNLEFFVKNLIVF